MDRWINERCGLPLSSLHQSFHHQPATRTMSTTHASHASSMSPMQGYYYWGADVVLLFQQWSTDDSWTYYLLSLLVVFVLTLVNEGISTARSRLPPHDADSLVMPFTAFHELESTLIRNASLVKAPYESCFSAVRVATAPVGSLIDGCDHRTLNLEYTRVLGGVAYAAQAAIAYQLMLMAMGFNVGVMLVIIAGHFVGYVLFVRFRRSSRTTTE